MRLLKELFRHLARAVAFFLFLLILIAGALTLAALYRPGWIINDRTVFIAASYLRNSGTDLDWKTIHADVRSRSLFLKELVLRTTGLCWSDGTRSTRLCTGTANVELTVDFTGLIPRIRVLGPVQVLSGELTVSESKESRDEERQPGNKSEKPFRPPSLISEMKIRSVDIRFDTLRLSLPDRKILASASLRVDGDEGQLDIRGRSGPMSVNGRIRAAHSGSRIRTTIQAELRQPVAGLKRLSMNDCTIDLDRVGPTNSVVGIRCPVRLAMPVPPKNYSRFKVPATAGLLLSADLKADAYPPSPDSHVRGTIEARLDPILAPLFRGGGDVRSSVAGIPQNFPDDWTITTDLALEVVVPAFGRVVDELRSTPWAVPAPLQALDGQVTLAARGGFDREHGSIPLRFSTDLASRSQRVRIDATGQVVLPENKHAPIDLRADIILSDILLELPRLDLARPPTFFPDSRIRKAETRRKKEGRGTNILITVRTPPGQPARLLSNLAADPVPVALDIRSETGKPTRGTVRIHDFTVQLFRKEAHVDHFDLALAEPSDHSPVNGKISFKYGDYDLEMLLLGTAGKPQMILQSEPPLPQEQLMAALLYGQPLDSLDPESQSSVGNAQAALADGVLNLASIFALASTPIQSVGYDPQKGVATMKVRIAEGTSLNLGASSSEIQEIGVRKKIGSHWSVSTQVENDPITSDRTVSAFLEWALRY